MTKLYLSPDARNDLRDIKEYISAELESPASAIDTVAKITAAIRDLPRFPHKGAPLSSAINVPTDYRFLVCGNYLVFYRCEEDALYVVRILYARRDYLKILLKDFFM